MSTVKISQLPDIPGGLNANTSNSLFLGVDIPTGVTGKFTATQLAERLYANNVLNVGDNPITLPNVVAQFAGDSEAYLQINLLNSVANGSADYVATADVGTDTTHYVNLGINNSNYATSALDGYLVVAGDATGDPGGNLMIGSITSGKQIEFVIGGFEQANVVARMIDDTGFRLTKKPIIFADGTSQNTAAESASFSQQAFATANSAAANTVYLQTINNNQNTNITNTNTLALAAYGKANAEGNINNTQNTNITAVNTFAEMASFTANSAGTTANSGLDLAGAAFNKANNALANTSGIFAGDLQLTGNLIAQGIQSTTGAISTGNLIVNGTSTLIGNVTMNANTYMTGTVTVNSTMVLANSLFPATESAFTITGAGSSQTPTQAGTLMQLTSRANTPARVLVDSFGTSNTAYPVIAGRNARGTVTSPTATQNNDILLRIAGNSYGTTGYAPFGDARIDFVATENHSDTNRGSRIRFWNTPTGSNVVNEIASFNADSVYFTGTVAPEKGFIYTPTILPGAQTAFTIDFSTTSLIKAELVADLTISLSNYVYGKVVEVWLTNTSGNQRTVTHGCTATNSTTNSTTFNMSATSSAYLRYFSIDGDNANTYVAIQHA
jgi:hypothetical protein